MKKHYDVPIYLVTLCKTFILKVKQHSSSGLEYFSLASSFSQDHISFWKGEAMKQIIYLFSSLLPISHQGLMSSHQSQMYLVPLLDHFNLRKNMTSFMRLFGKLVISEIIMFIYLPWFPLYLLPQFSWIFCLCFLQQPSFYYEGSVREWTRGI